MSDFESSDWSKLVFRSPEFCFFSECRNEVTEDRKCKVQCANLEKILSRLSGTMYSVKPHHVGDDVYWQKFDEEFREKGQLYLGRPHWSLKVDPYRSDTDDDSDDDMEEGECDQSEDDVEDKADIIQEKVKVFNLENCSFIPGSEEHCEMEKMASENVNRLTHLSFDAQSAAAKTEPLAGKGATPTVVLSTLPLEAVHPSTVEKGNRVRPADVETRKVSAEAKELTGGRPIRSQNGRFRQGR